MAVVENITVSLKVQDIRQFKNLISSLAEWVDEIKNEAYLSDAEQRLLNAAIELSEAP